jgi:transposase
MGVASGEIAIWLREARIFLDREKKLRDCLVEAAADEVRAKAKVALARKLAVVLHRMLADGTEFLADKTAAAVVR